MKICKLLADWYRLNTTKELINELEKYEYPETLIRVLVNSQNAETGIPVSVN